MNFVSARIFSLFFIVQQQQKIQKHSIIPTQLVTNMFELKNKPSSISEKSVSHVITHVITYVMLSTTNRTMALFLCCLDICHVLLIDNLNALNVSIDSYFR